LENEASNNLIQVHVRLHGFLIRLADRSQLTVEVEAGSSVAELLHQLARELGPQFGQALLDPGGNLQGGMEVVMNRKHLPARRVTTIPIVDESDMAIIPLVAGG
jgi:molybdopterin converting factor small subunit